MAVTLYKSTDASAPVLSNTAGALVGLLDACLVDGYGAQAAAGWSKAFSGTNKAAYRNGSAALARRYLAVDDTNNTYGLVRGYEAMTDVNTGTDPFPSLAQSVNRVRWWKSNAASSAWIVMADDRTCLLATMWDANGWLMYYFGDAESYVSGDVGFAVLNGTDSTTSARGSLGTFCALVADGTGHQGLCIGGTTSGTGSYLAALVASAGRAGASYGDTLRAAAAPTLAYPNIDGSLVISPIPVAQIMGPTSWGIRGQLRFVYDVLHPQGSVADGSTFGGVGSFAGRSFLALSPVRAVSYSAGITIYTWTAAMDLS